MADIFRFPFQEATGSSFLDTSGNGVALTNNGITPADNTTAGPGGEYTRALALNGIDEWFDLATQTISGEKTFAWWGKGKKDSAYSVLLGETAIARRVGYRNNNAQLSYVPAAGQTYDPAHGVDVQNVWHHVLIRVDASGNAQTFINGVLLAETGSGLVSDMVIARIARDSASNYHAGAICGLVAADHRYSDVEVQTEYERGIDSTVPLQFYAPLANGRYHADPGQTCVVPLEIGYAPGTPSLELQVEDDEGNVVSAWSAITATAGTAETPLGPRSAWLASTPALSRQYYVIKVRETTAPSTVISQSIGIGRGIGIWGQSNAEGKFTNAQALATYPGDGDATYWDQSTMAWREVDEVGYGPIHDSTSSQYSQWPLVANQFLALEPDVPVFFVPMAFGGSDIDNDWGDDGSVMTAARNKLMASKVNNLLFYIMQGEAHVTAAADPMSAATYKSEVLRAQATLTESMSGVSKLFVAQLQPLGPATYSTTYLDDIREGQRDLWDEPNVYQGAVFQDVLVADLSDEVHFKTDAEAVIVAERIYRSIVNQEASTASLQMLTLQATQGLQVIDVNYTRSLQTETIDTATWTVTGSSQTLNVSSAVASGSKVTLSLDAPLLGSQTVTVEQGAGITGRGANVAVDANNDPIPAESLVTTVVSSTADETAIAFVNNPTIAAMIADVEAIKAVIPSNERRIAGEGTLATNLDDVVATTSLPVSQVPVPAGRTVVLQHTSEGLKGEFPKTVNAGENKLFAVDFRKDMAVNQRFDSIVSIELESGESDGLAFPTTDRGVDNTQVKFQISAVTAGTYVIKITVTYSPNGEAAEGKVTLVVV